MTTNDEEQNPRLPWMVGSSIVLAIALGFIWWPGCRQYPAVTSKESLVLIKLAYAACNTRDTTRLNQVEKRMEALSAEGKMSPAERQGFEKILRLARAGDWAAAEKASFKFAQDQVGQGQGLQTREDDPRDKARKKTGQTK